MWKEYPNTDAYVRTRWATARPGQKLLDDDYDILPEVDWAIEFEQIKADDCPALNNRIRC